VAIGVKGERNALGEEEATDTPGRLDELNMACQDWWGTLKKT
jgi:hypothetical protein